MAKATQTLISLGVLLLVAAALFGVPKLPSLPEPTTRIELPCDPHPSLLLWWDRDNISTETDGGWSRKPAKKNVEYWHGGELVATRHDVHRMDFDRSRPYVAWRAVIGDKVYVTLANPTEEFKREIERCESLPVEFSAQ